MVQHDYDNGYINARVQRSRYCDNDASKFKACAVRFSSPVIPGETLVTKMWKDGSRVAFTAEVKETGKPYHADPMSARERRVIHMEAADVEGITTYTVDGSGGKHVVIALADEQDAGPDDNDDSERNED